MQTRALRSLVGISKVGSFVRAAEQMHMTLSALSMQMKSLEAELGVALFDRTVRPPRLTPVGRAVVAEAIPLLQREDRLVEACRSNDALVGRFRIGFVTTAAVRLLPPFLKNAKALAPQAVFEFETGLSKALQDRVVQGQVDAAVVTDADGLPDALLASLIREEPFVFAAHRDLMAEGLEGLLKHHAFFHFMPDTGIGKLIASDMSRYDRPAGARTIVLDNLEAIMGCVTSGLGFTLLPEPDVTRYRTEALVIVTPPERLRRRLVLATLRDGVLARHAEALVALLDTEAESASMC
jgi:DNA-binding transcriptional LysR family regulator